MAFSIAKLGYSSKPWRLLRDGNEVYVKQEFDHPHLGPQIIVEPVAADTKEGAIRLALDMLEVVATKLEASHAGTTGRKD